MKILRSNACGELLRRGTFFEPELISAVHAIVEAVREEGDAAVFRYEEKFDGTSLTAENFRVSEAEFEAAYRAVSPALLDSLRRSIRNIYEYHCRGKRAGEVHTDADGRTTGYVLRPVGAAGIYVPGGTAPLSSSVCMGVLPAKAAGVKRIVVATPAKNGVIHPLTLVAAKECGVSDVYKMGGAQAIAALAYGTQSVEKVNVIAGPGNIYVTLAKKEVYGQVGIDMLAGPSEILIVADRTADADCVAADVLSQAEHDVRARAIVLTDDEALAGRISDCVSRRLSELPRRDIAAQSLEENGGIVLVKDMQEACALADEIAPEHLELYTADPEGLLKNINNAGAVFLGGFTPEPVGDYFAGPDHILPTGGSAKFFHVLNEDVFLRKMSVISYTKGALEKDGAHIVRLAESEQLSAHARAVLARTQKEEL